MYNEKEIEDEENRCLQTTFRKGWPNAYANAIRDVGLVVDAVERLGDEAGAKQVAVIAAIKKQQEEVVEFRKDLAEQNRRIASLAKALFDDFKLKLDISTADLDHSRRKMEMHHIAFASDLQKQQADFLGMLITRQQSIEDDRRSLDKAKRDWMAKKSNERAEIFADRKALTDEVKHFWNLGVWSRIFVPKALRELSKKHADSAT